MTLEVRGLVRHFGGVKAVDGVDFSVAGGECVALIGPNGAGKSTLFACIAGQQEADGGEVRFHGVRIERLAPPRRLAEGIARTFQVAQTFEALTAMQNVQLALAAGARRSLRAWDAIDAYRAGEAAALLQRVGMGSAAALPAAALPYGAKKRLELAIALAATPRLLLLDEPAAGLAEEERQQLMALVLSLARDGMSVLYTEHNMDAVFGVADRVLVLIEGRLFAQGTPAEIARNGEVRARYLGASSQLAMEATDGRDA